jgi:hypothetical chaperone protein
MHAFCGFDFGTSNSTIGINPHTIPQLVPLENNKPIMRSAIFCNNEIKQWVFGQKGINHYLAGSPGRLMMSLKTVLGSSLMEDKTLIFNEFIPYSAVLAHFVRYLKNLAEKTAGTELTQVVMGRPVHFHDHDIEKDRQAQNTLEMIAREVGFKEVSFQYEPIAAAMTYEMSIKTEQLALIVDMGGGTSDFTIIRLHPQNQQADRSADVLANCGIHIAGTDFDQRLSLKTVMPLLGMNSILRGSSSDIEVPSMYYHDLTTWHTLNNLYTANTLTHVKSLQTVAYEKNLLARLLRVLQLRAGHHILDAVETSKQRLSEENDILLDLDFIESELSVGVPRVLLNDVINDQVQSILSKITETVQVARVKPSEINAIFYTGGSTKIPIIRENINALFPEANIVQGDAFGSVGIGLTIDAQRKYS